MNGTLGTKGRILHINNFREQLFWGNPYLFVVMRVPLPAVRMVAAMPTVVLGMSVEKTVAEKQF